MKKLIALILTFITLILSMTGCYFGKYIRGNTMYNLNWLAMQSIYAKVEADRIIFDKSDVTLDFYYGLYKTNEIETLEQISEYYHGTISESKLHDGEFYWESVYAIFLSNDEELVFENNNIESLIEDNRVNTKLLKFIDFKESFSTDYGFTSEALELIYNHHEKIVVPEDLFARLNGSVYIHIFRFMYLPEENSFINSNYAHHIISIKYLLIGDKVVLH